MRPLRPIEPPRVFSLQEPGVLFVSGDGEAVQSPRVGPFHQKKEQLPVESLVGRLMTDFQHEALEQRLTVLAVSNIEET